MSAKKQAMDLIKAAVKKGYQLARKNASKVKTGAKAFALAEIAVQHKELMAVVESFHEKSRKAIASVREVAEGKADEIIESAKSKALDQIQRKTDKAIGRLALIAGEVENVSANPASDKSILAATARVNQIVYAAQSKLEPEDFEVVKQFAEVQLGAMESKAQASIVSDFDPTGALESVVNKNADDAVEKAAETAGAALVEIAERESRKVDIETEPAWDGEIPPQLARKSERALKSILKNFEQGDFQTDWPPSMVKAALERRQELNRKKRLKKAQQNLDTSTTE